MSAAMTRRVRVLAPAKINTTLRVLGRRRDGYHEIETFLVAVDLFDEVVARANEAGVVRLAVGGPARSADVPDGRLNLAFRAASSALEQARVAARADPAIGVDLSVHKRIPSQSGLGGASADAAAAWLATRAAVAPSLPLESGERALAQLGSDCVFFLRAEGGAGLCTGRGERVIPRAAPRGWSIALVVPDVACPTASIYAALRSAPRSDTLARDGNTENERDWAATSALDARRFLVNDLEPAARAAVPALMAWRALLDDAGLEHFRMSGSGSSFFGLFADDESAEAALARMRELALGRALIPRIATVVHPCAHGSQVVLDT